MKILNKTVDIISDGMQYLAMLMLTCMFIFITIDVVLRYLNKPIVGQKELTELLMGSLIMLGLSYAQRHNAHIAIGLVVDRLPMRVQKCTDVLSYLLICFVSFLIARANLITAIGENRETGLLGIPYAPFRYLVAFGFAMWGVRALLNLVQLVISAFNKEQEEGETSCQ